MIDNKKFVKEINNIVSSSEKAKKLALAEIEKIDEKYRKLAEEEKKKLNVLVANLDAILKNYSDMLEPEQESEAAESVEEPAVQEEPEMVVDTIYKDNNIQEAADEVFEQEPAPAEGFENITESTWAEAFGDNMATEEPSGETAEVQDEVAEEAAVNHDTSDINNEWPMPEEWK